LVVIALALQTAETAVGVVNLYFYRTFPVVVPGAGFNAGILAVLVVATAIALRQAWREGTSGQQR
jgi:hypothetical protein